MKVSDVVTPAPPPAIQICHSLQRLSLNGLLIVTSSGWHTLVKPLEMTAKSIPLSRNLVLTDSLRCPQKESYTIIVEALLIVRLSLI